MTLVHVTDPPSPSSPDPTDPHAILRQAEAEGRWLADGLDRIARCVAQDVGLEELGSDLGQRAAALRSRHFKIVVVGDFSRGKSTLLNAMLGHDLLPQKVTPSTAIITLIEHGETPQVRIQFEDGSADQILTIEAFKRDYVLDQKDQLDDSEARDRFSRVHHAVATYPIELCRHGVQLVDSPGLQDQEARTRRVLKFLKEADAVIMVLDATALLKENETHFLQHVLRPRGFQNIFFAVNKWNLVADSVLRPEDAEHEFERLNARLRDFLHPFCVIDGVDRSADRIFRLDALGAVKARLMSPTDRARETASGLPAFEQALQHFLANDRGKARRDIVLAALRSTREQVERVIEAQHALAERSVADIEKEIEALQPKLERLRGIQQHIKSYLRSQSENLQDRLAISFRNHMDGLAERLPEEVANFDLTPITEGVMMWKAVTDWARKDENKLKNKVKRHLQPQIQALLEREIARWQRSVVQNELSSVTLDVEKYLQGEAAEYRRVLAEIEEQLGIEGKAIEIESLVHGWLAKGSNEVHLAAGSLRLGLLGDVGWLVAGIVGDLVLDATLTALVGMATGIGLVISAGRMIWRESKIRDDIRQRLTEALREQLKKLVESRTGRIRSQVGDEFDALSERIVGNIEGEITTIDASLQAILDRKLRTEFSAEEERQRLQEARDEINGIAEELLVGPAAGSPATV